MRKRKGRRRFIYIFFKEHITPRILKRADHSVLLTDSIETTAWYADVTAGPPAAVPVRVATAMPAPIPAPVPLWVLVAVPVGSWVAAVVQTAAFSAWLLSSKELSLISLVE